MLTPVRIDYTFTPVQLDGVAEDTQGALSMWMRQMADIQEAINQVHEDGADGIGCQEASEGLHAKLLPLLEGLVKLGQAADDEMFDYRR